MAWTYILKCSDDSFYVGSTKDLERRFGQHQEGSGAVYTRHRLPVEIVWAAQFSSIRDAFYFEKRVQGWGRNKRIALIDGRVDLLPMLASRCWASRRAVLDVALPEAPRLTAPAASAPWDGDVVLPDDPDDPWAPPVPRPDVAEPPLTYTRIVPES